MAGGTDGAGPCGSAGDKITGLVASAIKAGWGRWNGCEPATDAEIRRAGQDGKGVMVAPIAFVSEHSETLVELDIEYEKLAEPSRRARLSPRRDGGRGCGFRRGLGAVGAQSFARAEQAVRASMTGTARICPGAFVALRLCGETDLNGCASQYACRLHSLVSGLSHHRRDHLDGGHALSAQAVCLSHPNQARFAKARNGSR